MSNLLVRFEPAQEFVLNKLTRIGIYKTRSEAIRAGIMQLGKEHSLFSNANDLENELVAKKMIKISKEVSEGKRKIFSESEVKKKYKLK